MGACGSREGGASASRPNKKPTLITHSGRANRCGPWYHPVWERHATDTHAPHSAGTERDAMGRGARRTAARQRREALDALPSDNGGRPAGATGRGGGYAPAAFVPRRGSADSKRRARGGLPRGGDTGLALSPARCDPHGVYSSLATTLFAICQVYPAQVGLSRSEGCPSPSLSPPRRREEPQRCRPRVSPGARVGESGVGRSYEFWRRAARRSSSAS